MIRLLITLSPFWVTILDVIGWTVISLAVGFYFFKKPDTRFSQDDWLTKERRFERKGDFYRKTLKIEAWKGYLPDGSKITKSGFRKKHLLNSRSDYLQKFVIESRRAEWTHFVALFAIPFFLVFNTGLDELIVVVYGIVFNVPCALTQRYNRIRLLRVLRHREREGMRQ